MGSTPTRVSHVEESPTVEYLSAVEEELRSIVASPHPAFDPLYGMMRYHLGWTDQTFRAVANRGGKRLRPLLSLLACEACGGLWPAALPAAAAIELMHNFSLIHDDVEDRSRTRRGRPTVWARWGVAQAVNAGDAMFSLAFAALRRLHSGGTDGSLVLEAQSMLQCAALDLCQGQYLDLDFEKRAEVSIQLYLLMIEKKTAALITCATELGAVLGGADLETRARFRSFGLELGLAFQLVDDILGIWGDPEVTGKPAGDDIIQRKKTLPIIHALEQERQGESRLRGILAGPGLADRALPDAIRILGEADARTFTQHMADEHSQRALLALSETRIENPAMSLLRDLTAVITDREQ